MGPPKSTVWSHFTKDGKAEAVCRLCGARVKTAGNTSNMWTHLSKKHDIKKSVPVSVGSRPDEREEDDEEQVDDPGEGTGPADTQGQATASRATAGNNVSKRKSNEPAGSSGPKQATLEESIQRSKSFEAGGRRAMELDEAYLYMLMKDNMPLVSGQKEGFNRFCKVAVPLWAPPKRDRTTHMMEAKYDKVSEVVKKVLSELPSVCLTADNWTEKHSTNSYLGVTVHFPMGTEMETVVLGLKHLDQSHTADYLAQKFTEVLNDWHIDKSRVTLCVTDNAENIKCCVRQLFGSDKQLGCFDHTLNLIPKAALGYKKVNKVDVANVPGIPELLKRVKKIVTFSHTSYNFSNELKRLQFERGKTEGSALRLVQDCPTRWGSTYVMLDHFLRLSEIVTLAAFKFPDEVEVLSPHEQATLRTIKEFLGPFHEVTKEMSAEKQTTAGKVIPIVYVLRQAIEKIEVPAHDDVARRFRKFIFDEFDRRLEKIEEVMPLAIATLVDPRFQTAYFRNISATARVRNFVEDWLKKIIRKEINQVEAQLATNAVQGNAAEGGRFNNVGTFTASGGLWGEHDARVATAYVNNSMDDLAGQARAELRSFLHRPPTPRTCNPLAVWESVKLEYPNLYKIARQFIPMVGTSVPSERVFSDAGRIMSDDANRLSSSHLQQRLFLSYASEKMWNA